MHNTEATTAITSLAHIVLDYSARNLDQFAGIIYSVKITFFIIIKSFGNWEGILRTHTVFLIAPKFIKPNKRLDSTIIQNLKTIITLIWHFFEKCGVEQKVES